MGKVWNWWLRQMDCDPGSFPDKSDLLFAAVMTLVFGAIALFFALMLLGAIIASKGILLVVIAVVGGTGYGVYKAIEASSKK
jgi:hypothetical protein